VNHHRVVCL